MAGPVRRDLGRVLAPAGSGSRNYARLFCVHDEASVLTGWKDRAGKLRRDINVVFLAYQDPRVPWRAKVVIAAVLAYALCPLDLIPDFIPVIGLLDDLVIIPVGISAALRMMPAEIIEDCRKRVEAQPPSMRSRWLMAPLIILIWLLIAYLAVKAVAKAVI